MQRKNECGYFSNDLLNKEDEKNSGTLRYINPYKQKADDIWALGIVFYEMIFGKIIFNDPFPILKEIKKKSIEKFKKENKQDSMISVIEKILKEPPDIKSADELMKVVPEA